MIGFTEMLVILVVVLLIFGARRIPELGRSLGGGIKNFKKAISERDDAPQKPEDEKPDER